MYNKKKTVEYELQNTEYLVVICDNKGNLQYFGILGKTGYRYFTFELGFFLGGFPQELNEHYKGDLIEERTSASPLGSFQSAYVTTNN